MVLFRYSGDRSSYAATISMNAFDASYWRQVHDNIQLGTTISYNDRAKLAIGSIFYQWNFKKASVRALIDSEWSVGCTYSR